MTSFISWEVWLLQFNLKSKNWTMLCLMWDLDVIDIVSLSNPTKTTSIITTWWWILCSYQLEMLKMSLWKSTRIWWINCSLWFQTLRIQLLPIRKQSWPTLRNSQIIVHIWTSIFWSNVELMIMLSNLLWLEHLRDNLEVKLKHLSIFQY